MALIWRTYSSSLRRRPLLTSMGTGGIVMMLGDLFAQKMRAPQSHPHARSSGVANVDEEARREVHSFDWRRTLIGSSWSGFVFAPLFAAWFALLDRRIPGSTLKAACMKALTTNVVMVLPVNAGFLAYTLTFEVLLGAEAAKYRAPVLLDSVSRAAKPESGGGLNNQNGVTDGSASIGLERMAENAKVLDGEWSWQDRQRALSSIPVQVREKIRQDLGEIFVKSVVVWTPTNLLNFVFVPPQYRVLPTIIVSLLWNTALSLIAHRQADTLRQTVLEME